MRTVSTKVADVVHKWHVVDGTGLALGRLAARVARVLMGKHRTDYTPHVDCGDYVVIINCAKVKVTGRKSETQAYFKYSDYPGGLKVRTYRQVMEKDPGEVVRLAVRRMLPKTRLGKHMIHKLKTAAGAEHEHGAQRPQPLVLS
jgi:large subunit ribosomal protein L13